jgi:hypothetical protein
MDETQSLPRRVVGRCHADARRSLQRPRRHRGSNEPTATGPLPTTLRTAGVSMRDPREIESAAHFSCLEALQNGVKHARAATAVVIELSHDSFLRLKVRDDGPEFDPAAALPGVGLTSMRDRLDAVGGELAVVSAPGHGTRVIGRIPLRGQDPGGPSELGSPATASSSPRRPRSRPAALGADVDCGRSVA